MGWRRIEWTTLLTCSAPFSRASSASSAEGLPPGHQPSPSAVPAARLTNVNIALLDNDQAAVDLVGNVANLLTGNQRFHLVISFLTFLVPKRVQLQEEVDVHVERVREHLVAGDNVGVEKHGGGVLRIDDMDVAMREGKGVKVVGSASFRPSWGWVSHHEKKS